jgi:tRNA:m4X modification enzyme
VDGCRRVPYQEKHAVQQASLLGNMEAFGLLEKLNEEEFANRGSAPSETTSASHAAKQRAIVELGAGRGYLSHMLCDCYRRV